MRLFRGLCVTFSLYSAIPMPHIDWDKESMEWIFACLPLVGCVVGGTLWLWLQLAVWLGLGTMLRAAGATALPVLLTGGIHLDGLCDTCDALGSHQSRERMLEIMKDPHIGAFGVMGCVLYLLTTFAAWCQVGEEEGALLLSALMPIVSRSWVSLSVLTRPSARRSGLLATFTSRARRRGSLVIAALSLTLTTAAQLNLGRAGFGMALAGAGMYLYVFLRTKVSFDGLTGDLAGWELCLLELGQVIALAMLGGEC